MDGDGSQADIGGGFDLIPHQRQQRLISNVPRPGRAGSWVAIKVNDAFSQPVRCTTKYSLPADGDGVDGFPLPVETTCPHRASGATAIQLRFCPCASILAPKSGVSANRGGPMAALIVSKTRNSESDYHAPISIRSPASQQRVGRHLFDGAPIVCRRHQKAIRFGVILSLFGRVARGAATREWHRLRVMLLR
jgi:hypothetical protein